MRKIIGFKLPLRLKEIQRRAKKAKLDLEAAGLPEAELQALLDRATAALKPAVLFDTFPHPDAEQTLLSPLPGLAYSLVLGTLGGGFDALAKSEAEAKPAQAALWPVVREAGLEEAVRFATALLAEEAARDACELSPITPLSEGPALEAALRKLDSGKIGVTLENGALTPAASAACSLSWLAKTKAKGKAK